MLHSFEKEKPSFDIYIENAVYTLYIIHGFIKKWKWCIENNA